MTPTRPPVLVVIAIVAGLVAYLLVAVTYDDLPALPRAAPVTIAALGLIEVVVGRSVRARLAGRAGPRSLTPLGIARLAALARASSAGGAVVLGGYAGAGVYMLRGLEKSAYVRDAVTSLLGVVAALLLVVAALYLERSCRVPTPPEQPPPGVAV